MAASKRDRARETKSIGGRNVLSCAFAGLGAALCILLTLLNTLAVSNLVRNHIRRRLQDVVSVSALRIDGDLHMTLSSPEQEGGAAYRKIQQVLQELQRTIPDVEYVYTMRKGFDGGIIFVVDEETNEAEIAHLGDTYDDAGPGLVTHFSSMDAPFVEREIYIDRWGNWLSGYAPFYDSEGRRAGILGMDIRADDIAASRRRVLLLNFALFASILPVCALMGWFLANRMIVPVKKMAREAQELIRWPDSNSPPGSRVAELAAVDNALNAMRHLLDAMSDTVVATDLDGNIVYVNEAACTALQMPRELLLGESVYEFGESPVRGARQSDIIRMASDKGQWEGEVVNVAKDGSEITFRSRVKLLHGGDGAPIGLLGVSSNITDHRRAEAEKRSMELQLRQARKLEAVGQLAGGVAHDFNNLLMGIMNYVDLCREKLAEDHPVREWLDEIAVDAQRSANLTRQLLAFARRQPIAPQVLNLNDVVPGMLNMLQRLIGEDIEIIWLPGPNDLQIKMDPSQLDQILANLCVNARDAISGPGSVTIKTDCTTIDADYLDSYPELIPGRYVVLSVSDTGCGMDQETVERIFEPFFTTKDVHEGTGLGLSTVHGIVRQNNGNINVKSEPGRGTTFRIYLPSCTGESSVMEKSKKTKTPQGGGETILLVEDEKSIRVTAGIFLKELGYTVLTAESPEDALRLVSAHSGGIHLLITDVVMPGMSGHDLAERLTADFSSLKILYISGYTADAIAHEGVLDEGVEFLSKPINRDALTRKVRDILDRD